MFFRDTQEVLEIIKNPTVDTYDETWMKGKLFGQEAILEFQNHYAGKSEGEHRK